MHETKFVVHFCNTRLTNPYYTVPHYRFFEAENTSYTSTTQYNVSPFTNMAEWKRDKKSPMDLTDLNPSSTISLNSACSTTIPATTEVNDIQIQLPNEEKNAAISSSTQQYSREMDQDSTRPRDNGRDVRSGNFHYQRGMGVVQAKDSVDSQRMRARVLRKILREHLLSEKPDIFNTKL